jgi:hypothetical protein
VVVLLRTKFARGDLVADEVRASWSCRGRSSRVVILSGTLPLSNKLGETYRTISTRGTAPRRKLAIKAARLSAPSGEMRAQGSKRLLVVESIDPRPTVPQYAVCTIEGGETLNVPRGELRKEWLDFVIAAGRSVDCATVSRLEGLHPGATDDENSDSRRRGIDDAEAVCPSSQRNDSGDDNDTSDDESDWLTFYSWRRAATNDHYLGLPDTGIHRRMPVFGSPR